MGADRLEVSDGGVQGFGLGTGGATSEMGTGRGGDNPLHTGPLGPSPQATEAQSQGPSGSWDILLPTDTLPFYPGLQPLPVYKSPITPASEDHRPDRWPDRLGQGEQRENGINPEPLSLQKRATQW